MRKAVVLLLAVLFSPLALGQARAVNFQLTPDPVYGVRNTSPDHPNVNTPPAWNASTPSTINMLNGAATDTDLASFCENDAGDVTVTKQTGTYPAASPTFAIVLGHLTGTPTVNGTTTIVFRCTDPEGLTDDTSIDLVVSASPTSDTTPDPFGFVPKVGAATSSSQTSTPGVTITGINATTAVTVACTAGATGCGWKKNAGSCSASAGTVVSADVIYACINASGSNATEVRATVTVGGVDGVFSVTTVASTARNNIMFTLSGGSLTARVNPTGNDLGVPRSSIVDGAYVQHMGNTPTPPVPSNVKALNHFEIVAGSPGGGGSPLDAENNKWFKFTIYPDAYSPYVNYCAINGALDCTSSSSKDKPRINVRINAAVPGLDYGTTYRVCVGYYIPSTYQEDWDGREVLLQFPAATAPDNNMEFRIMAGGSASNPQAKFVLGRARNGQELPDEQLDLSDDMKGHYVDMMFKFNMDPTAGGTSLLEWTSDIDGNPATARLIRKDTTNAFGSTGDPDGAQVAINYYPGKTHSGSDQGSYTGVHHNSSTAWWIGMDAFRIGNASSTYQDCHPTRMAPPAGAN